jgi:hypothetical protein
MKAAAAGLRVHSGWTALVVVSVERGEPRVLHRDRVLLVKTFSFRFRQPYHTAEKMGFEQGRDFIQQVRTEACRLAQQALRKVQKCLAKDGYALTHCGLLLASARPLPDLQNILASHALIHTADGELFREAWTFASQKNRIGIFRVREKELLGKAAQILNLEQSPLKTRLTELGRTFGPPWSQDEKHAALVAWLALCDANSRATVA